MLGSFRVGADGQPDKVRMTGPGGVDLVAVNDPLVAVEDRLRPERGQVGAGSRLGVADGPDLFAAQDARQVAVLLRLRAERHQGQTHRVDRHERERRTGPLHLGEQDQLLERTGPATAVLLGEAEAEPAVRAELADQHAPQLGVVSFTAEVTTDVGREHPHEVFPKLLLQGALLGVQLHVLHGSHGSRTTKRLLG